LLVVFVSCCASTSRVIDTSRIVDYVNSNNFGWKAAPSPIFENEEVNAIKKMMGVTSFKSTLPVKLFSQSDVQDMPTDFDSRTQWPGCVGAVRDQGRCGSCWAFGGVEAISDRFCIQANQNVTLAPLDPVTCDQDDSGCEGGMLQSLWEYAKRDGVVTESCAPYNDSIPTCPASQQPCLNFVPTPSCKKKCEDGSDWSSSKHYVSSVYSLSRKVEEIQAEIQKNGPVEAAFSVYEDFLSYKSGVYKHVSGKMLGGHAIKIIGWGYDNSSSQSYWTVQNSWTTSWGDQGYFLILSGVNECGIEDNVVAGLVKASKQ
jgi:cathepsin B